MTKPLRVLLIEDSERDAELLFVELERGGYVPTIERVETAEGMQAALDNGPWDIIVSDYNMPTFTGLAALELLQRRGIDLPFIIVSGTIGEELAVAAMKAGAHDYLMKGNLARLVPAIERERREVAERRQRHDSEEQYRGLVEASPDSISLVDLTGTLVRTNHQTAVLFGFDTPRQMLGMNALDLIAPDDRQRALKDMQKTLQTGKTRNQEYMLLHANKSTFPAEVTCALLRDDDGAPRAIVSVARDISERRRIQHALEYQALHDPLTGLPNRTLLFDRLEHILHAADRNQTSVGLLLIDLDRFKEVNDTFGHHFGDALLRKLGPRLQTLVRKSDTVSRPLPAVAGNLTVARLGGDEFAVLLPYTSRLGATQAAKRILKGIARPFSIQGQRLEIGASIGIALYPEHGADAEALVQHVDVAMYESKRGSGGYAIYESDKDLNSRRRITLIGDLRQAIVRDELELYYQPKADLVTGHVTGVEALIRWQHPQEGFISPKQIVELAEHTGLMGLLSSWVLGTAIRQCRVWRDAGITMPVAVNLSARSLHDQHLVEEIAGLLRASNVCASRVGIEITESAVMVDPERALDIISRLHDMGITISIDDFGTGYSSLAYLKHLPVAEVKIDKSFVLNLLDDANDYRIVRGIISLAHDLGLSTIAEGIETREVWTRLRELGCDFAQGFYLSPPLPVDDITAWLQQPYHQAEKLNHAVV